MISLISVALSSTLSLAQSTRNGNSFTLTGKLTGRDSGILTLCYTDNVGKYHVDTTCLDQGNFRFSGNISEPTLAYLIGKLSSRSLDDPNRLVFFLEPGTITGKFQEGRLVSSEIKGSKTQNEFGELSRLQKKIKDELDSLFVLIKKTNKQIDEFSDSALLKKEKQALEAHYSKVRRKGSVSTYNFVKSHPNSVASAYLLENYIGKAEYHIDSLKYIYNGFSDKVRNSRLGKLTAKSIQTYEAALEGKPAPGFTSIDVKGNKLDLKNYLNKSVVLLDFWASWCVPCHLQAPHFIKLYDKYKASGFEIISISADTDRILWKKAIDADRMGNWKNLILADVSKFEGYGSLNSRYGIATYPTVILIDKAGKIVYRKSGFDEQEDPAKLAGIISSLVEKK